MNQDQTVDEADLVVERFRAIDLALGPQKDRQYVAFHARSDDGESQFLMLSRLYEPSVTDQVAGRDRLSLDISDESYSEYGAVCRMELSGRTLRLDLRPEAALPDGVTCIHIEWDRGVGPSPHRLALALEDVRDAGVEFECGELRETNGSRQIASAGVCILGLVLVLIALARSSVLPAQVVWAFCAVVGITAIVIFFGIALQGGYGADDDERRTSPRDRACSACGERTLDDALRCRRCGADQFDAIMTALTDSDRASGAHVTCPWCARRLSAAGASSCVRCGAAWNDAGSVTFPRGVKRR